MHEYQREMDIAREAAAKASEVIRSHYAELDAVDDAPASVTTKTDRASQEIILQHITRAFPSDALSAEESTATLANADQSGERLWIVDPIDGTRGFVKKNGEFSVMIGFVHRGQIQLGVVAEPATNLTTYALRGQGCWVLEGDADPRPCRVRTVEKVSEAILTQSHSKGDPLESWAARLLGVSQVCESYSAGVKLALVARGEADVYVNSYSEFHDWDICAGHILVEEAGGTVTGLQGETIQYGSPGAWQRSGLLASNGPIHAEVLTRLAP